MSGTLDLSKATKLKDLHFWWRGLNVRWIIAALQTIESKKLERITVYPLLVKSEIEDVVHRDWEDLDRLLAQFSTPHSIRARVMYKLADEGAVMKDRVPSLLPELSRRGLVDLVEYSSLEI